MLLAMLNTLKKEFSAQKLSFNLNDDENIHDSWVLPSWALLLLRLSMSAFCVIIIIVSVVHRPDSRWLIYLTNWSYLLLTLALIGLTIISTLHVRQKKQDTKTRSRKGMYLTYEMKNTQMTNTELPVVVEDRVSPVTPSLTRHEKIVWCLWVISANTGLLVTIEYWILVFRPPTSFMDITVHALNSVFILTELFNAKLPVRILHLIYVMLFAIVYVVFTVIYWAAGGMNSRGDPYIYDILDYENGKPGKTAAVILLSMFVVSPLIQFILFGLYQVKLFLEKKKNNNCNN